MTNGYARSALEREVAALRACPEGGRANAAFAAGAAIGNLVGGGLLDPKHTEELLVVAAKEAGLGHREAASNVRRGLRHGATTPRTVPTSTPSATSSVHRSTSPCPPRGGEAADLWARCSPVADSEDVSDWLRFARGIDLDSIDLWDLARVLPPGDLPTWAAGWNRSGHRMVLPLFDERGQLMSMRARHIGTGTAKKELASAGWRATGLVFADSMGQQLLQGAPLDWWEPVVVVAEGSMDFLTWATRQAEEREQGAAVFGVYSGGWTPAIGARIPACSTVALRLHEDAAGDGYAYDVARTLPNGCKIYRARREKGPFSVRH